MVKPWDINAAYQHILTYCPPVMEEFINYFGANFIDSNARYPRELWNHYGSFAPRTTNHVEGWHNCLNRMVGKNHANIWICIQTLVSMQIDYNIKLSQVKAGQDIIIQSTRTKNNIARTNRIINDYNSQRITFEIFIESAKFCF